MTRILLLEDDPSLGATLQEQLLKEGYEVVWANSVRQARSEHQRGVAFDLYIFDVGLPDGNGFDLAAELGPSLRRPLLFLTAQSDAESRLRGYDLGAVEYIPKPFHLRELLMRVRHVLESHRVTPLLVVEEVEVNFDSYTLTRGGHLTAVASKDLQLLKLLVDGSPRVVSRDEALNTLWGEDKFPSTRTVDNSILRLRAALGPAGHCIESVRGVGYRWNPPNAFSPKEVKS